MQCLCIATIEVDEPDSQAAFHPIGQYVALAMLREM
jgi:hypothetical protein